MTEKHSEYTLDSFLEEVYDIDPLKYRINIFNKVMNYSYQINDAKTIDALIEQQSGYCVPKARLLYAAYEKLGYQVRVCFIPFRFDMLSISDEFQHRGLAIKNGYHTFIQMIIDDNRIEVDATFHPALKHYFPVNDNWDGISSQQVICPYSELYLSQRQDDESKIKNILNDVAGRDDIDNEWIDNFNKWIVAQSVVPKPL